MKRLEIDRKALEAIASEVEDMDNGKIRVRCLDDVDIFINFGEEEDLALIVSAIERADEEAKICAAIKATHYNTFDLLLKLWDSIDDMIFYGGIHTDEELGEEVYDIAGYDLPLLLESYFDFESYGRDVRLDEGGEFTEWGYFAW